MKLGKANKTHTSLLKIELTFRLKYWLWRGLVDIDRRRPCFNLHPLYFTTNLLRGDRISVWRCKRQRRWKQDQGELVFSHGLLSRSIWIYVCTRQSLEISLPVSDVWGSCIPDSLHSSVSDKCDPYSLHGSVPRTVHKLRTDICLEGCTPV